MKRRPTPDYAAMTEAEWYRHYQRVDWEIEVGCLSHFLDWLTRGWWARVVLRNPDPARGPQ
jgi:hypothetical protein